MARRDITTTFGAATILDVASSSSRAFDARSADVLDVLDIAIAPLRPSKVARSRTGIAFNSGTSLASWGERISVSVAGDFPASVTVTSRLRGQMVGWGKNERNTQGILDRIGVELRRSPTTGSRTSPPPPSSTTRRSASTPPASAGKSMGFFGSAAAVGTGYAVVVYLGIPSVLILFVAPPIGLVMCALTLWLAVRAGSRVGHATQRGVTVVAAHIEDAIARFLAEYRAYESKWGEWTPPSGSARDDSSSGFRPPPPSTARSAPSPFATLGISESASLKEAQAAYRELMLRLHPDRHMDKTVAERTRFEDQAKVISEAYNAIKEQSRSKAG